MAPEDNPADDVQPTKEEWEEYERSRSHPVLTAEQMEVLARRAYGNFKPTGLCSRHHPDASSRVKCATCYPDWQRLLDAHMAVANKLYDDLLALSGLQDPPNGRIGTNNILEAIRRKLGKA